MFSSQVDGGRPVLYSLMGTPLFELRGLVVGQTVAGPKRWIHTHGEVWVMLVRCHWRQQ